MNEAQQILANVDFRENAYHAVENADAIIITTEWDEFRALDLNKIKTLMRGNALVDLRNIYREPQVLASGLTYTSVGRG